MKGKKGKRSILAVFLGLLLIQENENGCLIWFFSSVTESSLESFLKNAYEESSCQSTIQYFWFLYLKQSARLLVSVM